MGDKTNDLTIFKYPVYSYTFSTLLSNPRSLPWLPSVCRLWVLVKVLYFI